ncbi:UDP-2,3-diacylglucosamine diphosphatase LpxI [Nitratireductor mangrovi]|uniref:UDP-2,3-diacylglucosamine diphosphatase LpxI n=1 Tax=Nitratireductor mangrovi TaxID=2599600 RepID=A0A5B8L3I9_9HYPH|nr:UDP-2,3-diacylglucosamine diphosphatase LpxI [Nitratireductor mangrovi]QDZ02465.1 UDP-2,3-diacylglucosamine diphosphatase LpxI [Nitratireductor mangrovi]
MSAIEADIRLALGAGDRVAIIAGGGLLPVDLAQRLSEAGQAPFIVIAGGEVSPSSPLFTYDHHVLELEEFSQLVAVLKKNEATHVVLAGGIERRPAFASLKLTFDLVRLLPRVVAALAQGDDVLLHTIVGFLESRGFAVVGAHQLMPDLLAAEGALSRKKPSKAAQRDIDAAMAAARAIGALDIGQAAVSIGGRVIALEGIEGTDGLLERTRELRTHGRLAARSGGVLAKCAKPTQELRADLPTIGPNTIVTAHRAGLGGVAVEAGRSLVLDQPGVIEAADRLGMFVVGVRGEPR